MHAYHSMLVMSYVAIEGEGVFLPENYVGPESTVAFASSSRLQVLEARDSGSLLPCFTDTTDTTPHGS